MIRALAAALLALVVLRLIPGTAAAPAAPAGITGVLLWFALTARSDLAPPPRK